MIPNDTDADNRILKYKRMIRKSAINILAWLENNPSPTEEQFKEIKLGEHNAREALTYWSSDINAGWTQLGHSEMPLKVQQHKEYLKAGTDAQQEE